MAWLYSCRKQFKQYFTTSFVNEIHSFIIVSNSHDCQIAENVRILYERNKQVIVLMLYQSSWLHWVIFIWSANLFTQEKGKEAKGWWYFKLSNSAVTRSAKGRKEKGKDRPIGQNFKLSPLISKRAQLSSLIHGRFWGQQVQSGVFTQMDWHPNTIWHLPIDLPNSHKHNHMSTHVCERTH